MAFSKINTWIHTLLNGFTADADEVMGLLNQIKDALNSISNDLDAILNNNSGDITTDNINEKTTDNGVDIENVNIKDGVVTGNVTGDVTADNISVDNINEKTTDNGVTVDGCLIKDGKVADSNLLNSRPDTDFANANLSNVSDSTILTKVKNVDGSGSGLDSDTVDGLHSSDFANISLSNVNDNTILSKIKNVDGSGSGLDADKVDGLQANQFVRADVDTNVTGQIVISNIDKPLRISGRAPVSNNINGNIMMCKISNLDNGTSANISLPTGFYSIHILVSIGFGQKFSEQCKLQGLYLIQQFVLANNKTITVVDDNGTNIIDVSLSGTTLTIENNGNSSTYDIDNVMLFLVGY